MYVVFDSVERINADSFCASPQKKIHTVLETIYLFYVI